MKVARIIEGAGADALILSGGFTSKTPFYMMRGLTPHRELISYQKDLLIKLGMIAFSTPFDETAVVFLESLGAQCY